VPHRIVCVVSLWSYHCHSPGPPLPKGPEAAVGISLTKGPIPVVPAGRWVEKRLMLLAAELAGGLDPFHPGRGGGSFAFSKALPSNLGIKSDWWGGGAVRARTPAPTTTTSVASSVSHATSTINTATMHPGRRTKKIRR